ncbi:MAG: ABC transporter permease [Acidobacteriota bacterium]|nr:ABC transporter permease [Acidobacteriota bacterium]
MTPARGDTTAREDPRVEPLDLLEAEIHITADTGGEGGKARGWLFYLHAAAFVLGAALLAYVVNRIGVGPITEALRQVGYGFLVILSVTGARHVFRTASMSLGVAPEHRRFTFWEAYSTRLAGETITFLTFTGPVLGEATKAALLRKRVPLATGVQALVVDNLLYNLSVALFVSGGALVMLATYDLPDAAQYPLVVIAAGMMTVVVAIVAAVVSSRMPFTAAVDFLIRVGVKRRKLAAKREKVRGVEADVYDFYRRRPRAFFLMFACDFLAHATTVLEVFLVLGWLGFEPTARVAYIIDSLTKVINLVFGFVPATIGVYEGGTGFILHTLGYAAATGVTLGIVRKAGMIVWALVGLLMLVRHTAPGAARKILERHPRLRESMDNLVFSNMTHRPARTLVSVLGVAVGVLLVVFTVGLANGVLRERARREGEVGAEILVRASGSTGMGGTQRFTLPVSRADEIERVPGVRAAAAIGQKTDASDTGFGMRVVDGIAFGRYGRLTGARVVEGRGLAEGGDEAIVDPIWKEQRKAQVGDTVRLFERDFRIVGVYEPPGGGRIKIPLRTMQQQVGAEEGFATSVLVSCLNPAEQEAVAERIHQLFPEDQILFTRDLPELYTASVPALNVFISVVVGVAAVISVLVILLAMYTTVTERTKQIGVLKSLGMSNAGVAWIIEQEALVVSVLGVVLGVLLTLGARFLVMSVTTLTVDIEPRWLLISLGIGLLGGTLGALYPALRAARQDPVEALSYE